MLALFGETPRQGAIGLASLPEYWRHHWGALAAFVEAGVDGFEIVNCAPKALGFPAPARGRVLQLAAEHDLLVVGASDNHGWGEVTCVWRSEEHTSELQSLAYLVCRLLLEKKKPTHEKRTSR